MSKMRRRLQNKQLSNIYITQEEKKIWHLSNNAKLCRKAKYNHGEKIDW